MKFLLMKILVGEEFQWNHGVPYASFKYKDDFVDAVNLRDRKSTRLNSSHYSRSRMPSSA